MTDQKIRKAMFLWTLLFFISPLLSFTQDMTKISLAGEWKFAMDPTDEGLHKKWYLGNLKDKYLGNVLFDVNDDVNHEFIPSLTNQIFLPTTTDLAGFGMPDDSPWINYLQRKHKYIGVTWFQKVIDVPESWEGYITSLLLERVKWQSRVWIDGKEVSAGAKDGLVTSHRHDLGILKPGKHLISIRVDNRMIHPIGDKGHNYTELTESIWNGIVGEIELQRRTNLQLERVSFFPNLKDKKIRIRVKLKGERQPHEPLSVNLSIFDATGRVMDKIVLVPSSNDSNVVQEFEVIAKYLKPWDEFNPTLYKVEGEFHVGEKMEPIQSFSFGARDIKASQYKIVINDIPRYIRGNQEALGYPPTGHPPMDVESWLKIFKIYKDYGLNQVRFHSSCPPDAAFQAADQLGIYVMVELVWMTSINAKMDLRPISATMGIPQGLGNGDRSTDDFVFAESQRIIAEYGNHPSFCFFAYGNELDNINKEKIDSWIALLKNEDPRRLYAGTTARAVLPHDDFQDSHIIPEKGPIVNKDDYSNSTNYDHNYQFTKLPVIAHELGQYPVHPRWSDILKYENTPFRFINLERARERAQQNGVFDQDSIFQMSSGRLQQMLYKSEIERQLRSRYGAGFNLLQMNDYTGHGEALVGWLDAFYDSKGITTPDAVRAFCNDVVLLAEFPKYVWQVGDTIPVRFTIHNTVVEQKRNGVLWKFCDENGNVIQKGKSRSTILSLAEPTIIDSIDIPLEDIVKMGKYELTVTDLQGQYGNSWDFWIYPKNNNSRISSEIVITDHIDQAWTEANSGKRVLFLAHNSGSVVNKDLAGFVPVFWSTLFFPGRGSKTLGAVIDAKHPIFNAFPTDVSYGWQWRGLCADARGFVLDEDASILKPIVQPIDDFHSSRKLGTLFELKVGEGKLVICGYNLGDSSTDTIVSRQLLNSILQYMESARFNPQQEVAKEWMMKTFSTADLKPKAEIDSRPSSIKTTLPTGATFKSIQDNIISIHTNFTTIGVIKVNIRSAEKKQEEVELFVEHRKIKVKIKPNQDNWFSLQYFREDFDDQQILLGVNGLSKGLKIEEVQMIPEKE